MSVELYALIPSTYCSSNNYQKENLIIRGSLKNSTPYIHVILLLGYDYTPRKPHNFVPCTMNFN